MSDGRATASAAHRKPRAHHLHGGRIRLEEDGTKFYHIGTASGPLKGHYIDLGPAEEGQTLAYHFDHVNRGFMPSGRTWRCKIVRINRKSVTVRDTYGNEARIEL
jgi:hypothetical protein